MHLRFRHRVVLAALAALLGSPGVALASGAPGIRISRVDLRDYPTVRLTIVTSSPGLRPPQLFEEGSPAAGLQAANLGSSTSVALAIDRSHSMHGEALTHALLASRSFLVTKPPAYRVSVFAFASQPLELSPPSDSTADADSALRSIVIDAKAGTTMYDAIVLASKALQTESAPGHVIILVTDGQETTSRATLRQAILAARRAEVIIYSIAIKDSTYTPRPLRALSRQTGGRMFVAGPHEPLTNIYRSISSQLERTWQMSYYTAARPGGWIDLSATTPSGARAETRISIPTTTAPPKSSMLPFEDLALAAAAAFASAVLLVLLRTVRARSTSAHDLY